MHAGLYYCTLGGSTDSCDLPLTTSYRIALHITYTIKLVYSVCAYPVFIKMSSPICISNKYAAVSSRSLSYSRMSGQFLTSNVGTKPATQHASALTMGSWTLNAPQHRFTQFPWLHFYSKKSAMFVKKHNYASMKSDL